MQETPFKHRGKLLHCESGQMLDHNIQYCGEDGQNLTGHIPEQPAVSNPAVSRAEGWTR